jgi:uncharacterized membrane protein
MSWILPTPTWIYYIFLGIAIIAISSILLKKGSRTRKILSAIITIVVLAIASYFINKPTKISVSQTAITINKRHISFDQIKEAAVMKSWQGSPYQPTLRIGGTAVGKLRTGHFKLKNGKKAYLALWLDDRLLRIITQDSSIYLVAPREFDGFLTEVQKYITVMPDTSGGIKP